jgi:flagellar motor stator protein MotA
MLVIVGFVVVLGCVVGGYIAAGGHMDVLFQPFEFLIIFGAMIGSVIISNPGSILKEILGSLPGLLKGGISKKQNYVELLSALYSLFKLAKTKGDIAVEPHIEKPKESAIFQNYKFVSGNHHLLEFICDNFRLLTLGSHNSHELEAIMELEIEGHKHHHSLISGAVTNAGDALPALGIVAAVLGVIHTMGSITEPPEVLGHLIGAALVGTFSGILAAYGFVAPVAKALESKFASEDHFFDVAKTALVAHTQGYAPQISVEFARKTLSTSVRPSFAELDEKLQAIQS